MFLLLTVRGHYNTENRPMAVGERFPAQTAMSYGDTRNQSHLHFLGLAARAAVEYARKG